MIGEWMFEKAHNSAWDTPLWSDSDNGSGGVTQRTGAFLYGLIRLLRPAYVLEVGTSYGFSTLHIATALKENKVGKLFTVEIDKDRQQQAVANIAHDDLLEWVVFEDEIKPRVYDFIFLDAGHEPNDVIDYMSKAVSRPRFVGIHDAMWNNNAREVADRYGYTPIFMNDGSSYGFALLWKIDTSAA